MVAGERFCGIRSHQAPKVVSLPKRPPGDDRAGARQPFGGKPAGVQWGVFMRPQACAFAGHQTDAPQTLLIPFLVHFSCCQSYGTDTATDGRFDTFTRFSPEALRNSVQGLAQTGFGVSMSWCPGVWLTDWLPFVGCKLSVRRGTQSSGP